jgi:tetratricopeptide (TPR) repeat protein
VAATGAAAAQPSPVSEKQRQQAGELVKKAIANSQAGDHDSAIDLYLQAYAMIPTPILLSNIGSEYQSENKPTDALKYFCRYLEADPEGANVGYATAQAKAVQSQLGNPGLEDKDVCKPRPATPPPPPDGSQDDDHHSHPPPPPPPHPGRTLQLAGLATSTAGVIAFGFGVYFGLRAKEISDDISSHPSGQPWRQDIVAYEQEGQDDNTRGIALLVAGGVVAATGVTLYMLGRNRHLPDVVVRPTASHTAVGVSVSGGF